MTVRSAESKETHSTGLVCPARLCARRRNAQCEMRLATRSRARERRSTRGASTRSRGNRVQRKHLGAPLGVSSCACRDTQSRMRSDVASSATHAVLHQRASEM
eukprot:6210754-Pleurochrysis_carterae.AAC.1